MYWRSEVPRLPATEPVPRGDNHSADRARIMWTYMALAVVIDSLPRTLHPPWPLWDRGRIGVSWISSRHRCFHYQIRMITLHLASPTAHLFQIVPTKTMIDDHYLLHYRTCIIYTAYYKLFRNDSILMSIKHTFSKKIPISKTHTYYSTPPIPPPPLTPHS